MKNITVSSQFKAQTTKTILGIVLFIITYLALLILTIGLTIFSVLLGIKIIISIPGVFSIGLGIGLVILSTLLLIFLLKFLFKSHKIDRSHLIEITEYDEPDIFKMISEIVNEVGTTFPKKVYLSSDVNASVFYDSSFWSMFLPVEKNLQIGLGLANSVTKSEFKAILSHEFGHFSQKTMKVGSYVYNVNQVIFNMLFDNEDFENIALNIAGRNGFLTFFVNIAVRITEGVKWILRQMYNVINKSYMGLSREMEFHADEIAASVTGHEPLKTSLLRLSFADHCFNAALSFYDGQIKENKKSNNIFKDHSFIMGFLAQDNEISLNNNLPDVTEKDLNKFNKSKLVVKDQWASHPSTEDRVKRLEKTGLNASTIDNNSANQLFANIEKTQIKLTENIFNQITYTEESTFIPTELFQQLFTEDYNKGIFPKLYKGYYDNKNPLHFDLNDIDQSESDLNIDDLFSTEKIDLVYTALSMQVDIESIKNITDKNSGIKSFDYDGIKFTRREGLVLYPKLKKDLELLMEKIRLNDIKIYRFFKNQEQKKNKTPLLDRYYQDFFDFDKEYDVNYDLYVQLSNSLQFINQITPFEQIQYNLTLIEPLEEKLKNNIKEILDNPEYQKDISDEIKESFELYISKKWYYFVNESYIDKNLELLFSAMNGYAFLLTRRYFIVKQKLLNYQSELVV